MKKLAMVVAVVAMLAGCAALNGGKPYTFWTGGYTTEQIAQVTEVDVFETTRMYVWCPKYPNAFACALGVGGRTPSIAVRKGFLSERLIKHELCHHVGFEHEVTLMQGTTDQWHSGDAPCPVDVSRIRYRIVGDL